MKYDVEYHGNTKKELANLPQSVLEKFAQDLDAICDGLERVVDSKTLNGLGQGVKELRKNGKPAYRLVYVILSNVVHILHVFSKTSNGTDKKHEVTIKQRYKNL